MQIFPQFCPAGRCGTGSCVHSHTPNPYNWSGYIVGQILSKPEYMGRTVNFRSHKQSCKDKNPVMNPLTDLLFCADCGAKMDVVELMDARLAVREEKERSVVDRVKAAYGEKYAPMMMHSRFFALYADLYCSLLQVSLEL